MNSRTPTEAVDDLQPSLFEKHFPSSDRDWRSEAGDLRFRGAEVLTYLDARDSMLSRRDAKRLNLQRNFRSSEGLLDGLNRIFQSPGWFKNPAGMTYSVCSAESGNKTD